MSTLRSLIINADDLGLAPEVDDGILDCVKAGTVSAVSLLVNPPYATIARPILVVSTPIGVAFGLREAWRLAGPVMTFVMAAMLAVVGGLLWMTVRRIRAERE